MSEKEKQMAAQMNAMGDLEPDCFRVKMLVALQDRMDKLPHGLVRMLPPSHCWDLDTLKAIENIVIAFTIPGNQIELTNYPVPAYGFDGGFDAEAMEEADAPTLWDYAAGLVWSDMMSDEDRVKMERTTKLICAVINQGMADHYAAEDRGPEPLTNDIWEGSIWQPLDNAAAKAVLASYAKFVTITSWRRRHIARP